MKPDAPARERRRLWIVRRLQQALDVPMAVLSVAFLVIVVADLALPPASPYRVWADQAALAIWALFLFEFGLRFVIAPKKLEFLKRSWFDILVLAVPMLRVLRALRALRFLRAARTVRMLSLFRLGSAGRRGARVVGRYYRKSRLDFVLGLTAVVVPVVAAAVYLLERDVPNTAYRSFGDALYWSAAVVTTVATGYEPATPLGRVLSLALMVYGMVIFGYLVTQAVVFLQPANQEPSQPPR